MLLCAPLIALNIVSVGPAPDDLNIPNQVAGYFQSGMMFFIFLTAFFGSIYAWSFVTKIRKNIVAKRQIQHSESAPLLLDSNHNNYSEL
jgi:hypothetical protein